MIFLFICGVMNIATIFIPKTTGRSKFRIMMQHENTHMQYTGISCCRKNRLFWLEFFISFLQLL